MSEFFSRDQIEGVAAIIRNRSVYAPTIGLILGSGLGALADSVAYPDFIPYDTIPHWPVSSVQGHQGQLVLGRLEGKTVMAMQGRTHFYEGYSMGQITLPVRVMGMLGIKTVIITNAAGGINQSFTPGDLMLIRDHLNFPGLAGQNPLRGPNDEQSGPRFPDMSQPYSQSLRQLAHSVASEQGLTLQEGVYAFVAGPSYETPAELQLLGLLGADAVGMSTVPETIVARHAGMAVLGISTITNLAVPLAGKEVTHSEVMEVGAIVVPKLSRLVRGILQQL